MSKVLDAAERVRAAAQARRDRDAAGETEVARLARDRAIAGAQGDRAREEQVARFEELKASGREALRVAGDALRDLERVEQTATRLFAEHRERHALRRDVAEAALARVLGHLDTLREDRVAQFARQLCDVNAPPRLADALEVADLVARDRDDTAQILRDALSGVAFPSTLTAEDVEAQSTAAAPHLAAIRAAVQAGRAGAGEVGAALKRLDVGTVTDATDAAGAATEAAAGVLAVEESAQGALHKLRAALNPTTEEKT